ncbi:AcrR family transcriptional regulator [Bradyrhizobium sp. AZCC 1678]|uniref:TetR family transcriptional regulator n=1 Tax=Bradyrhizobium sp. AZCC 1678 TaxID=3117030 RepID=UPI002FF05825
MGTGVPGSYRLSELQRLAEGLDAVVVQRVAAAVGITDAGVHYHFESRMGLIEALMARSAPKLMRQIGAVIGDEGPLDLQAVSRSMRAVYDTEGAARMVVWMQMAGWAPRRTGMLSSLVERAGGTDEARRLIALLNAIHIATALMGNPLLRTVSLPSDASGRQAFLDWATDLVAAKLAT